MESNIEEMKKVVLYLLFALLLVNCSQPQTLSELKSAYVTIDDSVRVHYKIWNSQADAKTICFVHGFGCDMNTWEKQFEAFRDEKNLQLVFIDLPGSGQSDKPHVDYTLDFFAHAIDEVLKANNIKDAVFVGHSLGTPVCRQTLLTTGHKGALVDIDGVYCFYDGTETPEYVEAVNQGTACRYPDLWTRRGGNGGGCEDCGTGRARPHRPELWLSCEEGGGQGRRGGYAAEYPKDAGNYP